MEKIFLTLLTSLIIHNLLFSQNTKEYPFKTCHNCFINYNNNNNSDSIISKYDAIEIDIYPWKSFAEFIHLKNKGKIFIRHGLFHSKSSSIFSSDGLFDSSLLALNNWHLKHPNHKVKFVFVDLKTDWNKKFNGTSLEKYILKYINKDGIYTLSKKANDTLNYYQWPTLDSLNNKLVFILTGGYMLNPNKTLKKYTVKASSQLFFVAPSTSLKKSQVITKYFKLNEASILNFDAKNAEILKSSQIENKLIRCYNLENKKIDSNYYLRINFPAYY